MQLGLFAIILGGPLPLAFSLVGFAEGGEEEPSIPRCVLLVLTSWCVIETCLGLILGTIHKLALGALLVSEAAIFIAGLLIVFRMRYYSWFLSFIRRPILTTRLSNSEKIVSVTMALVAAFLLLQLVLIPITDDNSTGYHLSTMATWYQTSTFTVLDELKNDPVGRYHFGWELLCTLFIMPFQEDFLVAAPNLIAWTILGVSIYLIARSLGALRIHGMGSSALTLTILMITEHVNGMRVDLPVAAFFVASLSFGILYDQTRKVSYLGTFLGTLGMLIGLKSSGILYAMLLVAALAFLRIKSRFANRRSGHSAPRTLRSAPLFLLSSLSCFLLLASFWFLKNLIEVRNPFGYVKFQLGGLISFPGTVDPSEIHATSMASAFKLNNLSHWKVLLWGIVTGLNVPFIAMATFSTLGILLLPFRFASIRRERRINVEHFIGLIALMVGTVLIYWNTPYTADNGTHGLQITPYIDHQLRFAFPLMGILGVATALSATILRTKEEVMASLVIVGSVISVMQTPHVRILYFFLCFVVGLLLLCSLLNAVDWTRLVSTAPRVVKLCTAFVLIGLTVFSTFVARWDRDRHRTTLYYGIPKYIENNISPEQTIGYLLCYRQYLLFGKNLDRRKVIYVPSESDSLSQWLQMLQKRGVDFVAVGPILREWRSSRELSWLENSNGAFVHVFGRDPAREIFLYRFVGTNMNPSAGIDSRSRL
jgi:hypothetical protein